MITTAPTNGHRPTFFPSAMSPPTVQPASPLPRPVPPLPPPPMPPEALKLLVERNLYRLLAELPPGWPVEPLVIDVTGHGTAARLRVGPPGNLPAGDPAEAPLSAREREVLATVQAEVDRLGRRVVGAEVHAAMRARGHRWGRSTVNTALADLVGRRLLFNDNDKRGYGLTEDDGP